jgi:hypothetical protein
MRLNLERAVDRFGAQADACMAERWVVLESQLLGERRYGRSF